MKMRNKTIWTCLVLLFLAIDRGPLPAQPQEDETLQKIIEAGTRDNRVMTWNDYASNRFGGRETGSNAYNDATAWAVWQFRQWGLEAELEEAGEVPVGFNRGPWSGKMTKPAEKSLFFSTPSFTAGTKGVQRGPVVVLKSDPFSIPGRNATPENIEKKRAAVSQALEELQSRKSSFNGAWVLIAGESTGFARDGRRGTPEYSDAQLIPPLTKALVDAGALGTIQMSKEEPFRILDGYVESWDKLPVLPDIKLVERQYNEIKSMVEKGEPVELEFDIRNWFKMGPVKYHNVVATLRGSTHPDEYVIMGGHFDCFSGATGAVDDGSGFAPGMEAIRMIQAVGAKPKRSIVFMLFAAEESGLVGSLAWLKKHPEAHAKIVAMINRDGSPSAITGAAVPETWYSDFQKITAPLVTLNPKWPFKLERTMPRAHATSPGGSDHSSFEMSSVPTLSFRTQTNYSYMHAWHTLYDTYNELVPYTEHQQHSALATAVVVYGIANLDRPLSTQGIYLSDGLFADIAFGPAEQPFHVMAELDYVHAPLPTAHFVRIVEGNKPPEAGRAGGPGTGGFGGPGRGGSRPEAPPIGSLDLGDRLLSGLIESETQKSVRIEQLPLTENPVLRHDAAGILGVSGPNGFYITLSPDPAPQGSRTPIGKLIAGMDQLKEAKKGDSIRSIRITRVGQAARDFKTDDEAFKRLLDAAAPKK